MSGRQTDRQGLDRTRRDQLTCTGIGRCRATDMYEHIEPPIVYKAGASLLFMYKAWTAHEQAQQVVELNRLLFTLVYMYKHVYAVIMSLYMYIPLRGWRSRWMIGLYGAFQWR